MCVPPTPDAVRVQVKQLDPAPGWLAEDTSIAVAKAVGNEIINHFIEVRARWWACHYRYGGHGITGKMGI